MSEVEKMLGSVSSVLVIDWPSREVPDALVAAGYAVVVKSGPDPDSFSARELSDGRSS